jgi:hypothetical protein
VVRVIPISKDPEEPGDEVHSEHEQDSTDEITKSATPVTRAVIEIPDTILQEYRTYQKQQERENKITRRIAVATVLSAWVYAGIATFQWCTMQKTLTATNASVDFNKKSLQISKRPWVVLTAVTTDTPFIPGQEWKAKVWLKNTGETPALGFSAFVYAYVAPFSKTALPCEDTTEKSHFTLGPGVERHYDATFVSQPPGINELILKDTEEGVIGRQTMYICGVATYRDVLSCPHWTQICAFYSTKTRTFTACPAGDVIDEETCPES